MNYETIKEAAFYGNSKVAENLGITLPESLTALRDQLQNLIGWKKEWDVQLGSHLERHTTPGIETVDLSSFAFSAYQHHYATIQHDLSELIQSFQRHDTPRTVLQPVLESIISVVYIFCQPKSLPALPQKLDVILTEAYDYADLEKSVTQLLVFESNAGTPNQDLCAAILIKTYLDIHFHQNISLRHLSEKFNFEASYLSKIFKKKYAVTPIQYIQKKRIEEAKQILQSNPYISIQEISKNIGYKDALYFSKLFKTSTGYSPKEYQAAFNYPNQQI